VQKITKKTAAKGAKDKPTKKPKVEETETSKIDDDIEIPSSEDEEEQEYDDEVQILASKLDPEDEDDTPEEATVYKTGQPVGNIPDVSQAVEEAAKKFTSGQCEPGVIYVGRIPHGFYEREMRNYFSQFGHINKLRLSRNKTTGRSKHFAFIEFAEATTAEIVSKTMDNYLLFGHILKCHTLAPSQVHRDLFKGANRRFKSVPWNKIAGKQLEKPLSEAKWEKRVAQEKTKRAIKAAQLKEIGYDFEAPDIKDIPPPAAVEPAEETKAIEEAPAEDEQQVEEGPAEEEEQVEEPSKPVEEKESKAKSISAPKPRASKAKPTAKSKGRRAKV
jgi:nucleolar protein 15